MGADTHGTRPPPDAVLGTWLACLGHAVIVLDEDARIAMLNDAARAMLGHAEADVVGSPLTTYLAGVSAAQLQQVMSDLSCEPTRSYAWSLRTPLGTAVPVRMRFATLPLAQPPRVIVSVLEAAQHGSAARPEDAALRAHALTDCLPHLIWTCRADGWCDYVSRTWMAFTGLPQDALLGSGWLQQVHPDDLERLAAQTQRAMATGQHFGAEFRIRRRDGAYRWFDGQAEPLVDAHGHVLKWVGANTEIHASRALREQLHTERERLATVLDNSPGMVIALERDAAGAERISFVSAGATTVSGFSPAELEADARQLFARIAPEDRPAIEDAIAQSARDGAPLSCEFRYHHPQTGDRWLELRSRPRSTPEGRLVWWGLITDVTSRKSADEALVVARAQLESALEAAGMGAYVWDYEHNRIWANETQRKLWEVPGDTPEWFDPELVSARIDPQDRAVAEAAIAAAIASGERLESEFRLRTGDGGERWIESRARVHHSPHGRSHQLAGINLDITQRKVAADAAMRSQKLEALGKLAGGIAHDFNNVLFAISGNAALVRAALPLESSLQPRLDDILTASARAAELVRQILAFSRPQDTKREVMRLAKPVQEALKLVRAAVPATIDIHSQLDPQAPPVSADAGRIVQIVVNLCTNAAQAIGKSRAGTIRIRIDREEVDGVGDRRVPAGLYAVLVVEDDGSGIDPAIQARIFDPFFTTKPQGEGTGLGLSVVHGVVSSLGGHLTLWSQVGIGTTFRVYLPAANEDVTDRASLAPSCTVRRGTRVLLVDDEPMLAKLGHRFLEALGYVPSAFTSPQEALDAFRREPDAFAAAVTDLAMPSLSGFDLVRRLRELRRDLPVVMMTGRLGAEGRQRAAELGIHEIALKPLSIQQLGEALEHAFRAQGKV